MFLLLGFYVIYVAESKICKLAICFFDWLLCGSSECGLMLHMLYALFPLTLDP